MNTDSCKNKMIFFSFQPPTTSGIIPVIILQILNITDGDGDETPKQRELVRIRAADVLQIFRSTAEATAATAAPPNLLDFDAGKTIGSDTITATEVTAAEPNEPKINAEVGNKEDSAEPPAGANTSAQSTSVNAPSDVSEKPIDAKLAEHSYNSFFSQRKLIRITGTVIGISRYTPKASETVPKMSIEIDDGESTVYVGLTGKAVVDKFQNLLRERVKIRFSNVMPIRMTTQCSYTHPGKNHTPFPPPTSLPHYITIVVVGCFLLLHFGHL